MQKKQDNTGKNTNPNINTNPKINTLGEMPGAYNSALIDNLFDQITPEQQESTDCKMKLAAKIYKALQRKGWTQTQLAAAMGKPVSLISKWLSGTHNFTVETLLIFQRILEVRLLDITDPTEHPIPDIKLSISAKSPLNNKGIHKVIYESGGLSPMKTFKINIVK